MNTWIVFGHRFVGVLWLAWLAYWIAAARHTATNRRKESWLEGAAYRIPLLAGLFFVFLSKKFLPSISQFLWPQSAAAMGIGIIFAVAGLGIAVWARIHLGKYWSGRVTIKVDHRVIQTGPYAWVRHPIYTGLLLALLGTLITVGTLSCLVGFVTIFISVLCKLALEEKWLRAQFGEEYEDYRRRVKALVPHP
jgi:protein-S-isoprenylcysteine O-methyltransferase Ste14